MEASALSGPSAAYLSYCLGGCIRYFAVAGGLYWLFHVAFKGAWMAYRIQPTFPSRSEVVNEIRWSMLNTACTGLSSALLYQLIAHGHTRMYFAVAEHGALYFALSVVGAIVAYDAWFYWQHRALHTPWLFRHVHAIHHRAVNPTPFAAFAHHPVETFMGNTYFVLLVVWVPMHPMALAAVGLCLFALNIVTHLGYEFYPRGFTRHRWGQWSDTSTHHNMHHSRGGCNYSICFNYWDRWMGTNHTDYHDTFEAITARAQSRADAARSGGRRLASPTVHAFVDSPTPMADAVRLTITNWSRFLR
jgi:lathosterol oxidase